ncbi:hypothetical protein Tco_1476062 [Tanacetum coccineum]
METQKPLLKDEYGKEVDVHIYRSMIGSLMYLTSSRPDIMFAVCACARYQVNPKVSHLHAVKRIFSDYARASLDRKSTTGGYQFLGCRLISWQCKKQTVVANSTTKAEYVVASSYEAIHKELGGSLVRVVTTASSLEVEQDSGNISKTQSKATPSESSSLGTTSGGGPKCQETIGDTIVQTRVKSSGDEESLGEDASKQGRIDAIDVDEEITLENNKVNVVKEVVEVISAAGNVVSTAGDATTVSAATITTDDDGDITLAQALIEMKSTKPKNKGVVIQELGESTTTISSQLSLQQSHDKGKGILIEPVKPLKKKDLIRLDEEAALKLQAEFDEEERLARERAEKEKEANIALIETWDDIQVKIDVDHQLVERLQAQEQEELSVEEKATLFQQLLEKRRKHFATKRAEEKRNKPPTKAQQRKIITFKIINTFEYFRTDLVEGKEKRAGIELGNLKTMFEPHVEDVVWRNQQGYKVLEWKLYDSCEVHSLMVQHVHIYMLVEKKYPLAPLTLLMMLEKKLKIDYESEMAYQLLKFITKQLKK